jgi:hypothetical protein
VNLVLSYCLSEAANTQAYIPLSPNPGGFGLLDHTNPDYLCVNGFGDKNFLLWELDSVGRPVKLDI